MKKIYVVILGLAYLLFCTSTMKAETLLQESKDVTENVKSLEEREHPVTHVFSVSVKYPVTSNKADFEWDCHLHSSSHFQPGAVSSIPIFLLHCNFRR